jgi:hypothetical protein
MTNGTKYEIFWNSVRMCIWDGKATVAASSKRYSGSAAPVHLGVISPRTMGPGIVSTNALLDTNRYLLEHGRSYVGNMTRSIVIPPVYISEQAHVENSVIGPYVSVAAGATVKDSRVKDSIINAGACIKAVTLHNSLIGAEAFVDGTFQELNVGDASEIRMMGDL